MADQTDISPLERRRPVVTVLDTLRVVIDPERFDAVIFSLESVAADLGYGDVRPLPGAIAWIDSLRAQGKQTILAFSGESAAAALEIAGIDDRFDLVARGYATADSITSSLAQLGVAADRAVVVDVAPEGIAAAREAGCELAIAVARGAATPEQLRRSGASTVVADLQELLR
jgi:HAD superfamily hydrolase (TIGR01509 family)